MKLILEKEDVVRIIGRHFDAELDPERVVIRTDPIFEIEVSGIPLADSTSESYATPPPTNLVTLPTRSAAPVAQAAELLPKRADDNASLEPPEPGMDELSASDEGEIHPAAIVMRSKQLADELDKENPQLSQQRRRKGGTGKPPPSDFSSEIS